MTSALRFVLCGVMVMRLMVVVQCPLYLTMCIHSKIENRTLNHDPGQWSTTLIDHWVDHVKMSMCSAYLGNVVLFLVLLWLCRVTMDRVAATTGWTLQYTPMLQSKIGHCSWSPQSTRLNIYQKYSQPVQFSSFRGGHFTNKNEAYEEFTVPKEVTSTSRRLSATKECLVCHLAGGHTFLHLLDNLRITIFLCPAGGSGWMTRPPV